VLTHEDAIAVFWLPTVVLLFGLPVLGATITVTNINDSGPGSLRAAIVAAASGDTVTFDPDLWAAHGDIPLASTLVIDKNLTIVGFGRTPTNPCCPLRITGLAGKRVRVFEIAQGVTVAFYR